MVQILHAIKSAQCRLGFCCACCCPEDPALAPAALETLSPLCLLSCTAWHLRYSAALYHRGSQEPDATDVRRPLQILLCMVLCREVEILYLLPTAP